MTLPETPTPVRWKAPDSTLPRPPRDGPRQEGGEPTANQVYCAVQRRPGSTARELGRLLNLSRATVEYHLAALRRQERIREANFGRFVRCFPMNMSAIEVLRLGTLRQPRVAELAQIVVQNPGRIQRELVESISMSRKVFRACARWLVKAGLLEERQQNAHRGYYPTDPLRKIAGQGYLEEPGKKAAAPSCEHELERIPKMPGDEERR